MTKKYDEEFKRQMVYAYMRGTSYPQLEKEYGVASQEEIKMVDHYSR